MQLSEIYGAGKLGLSYELYPPKTEAGLEALFTHLKELVAFQPSYITCTYGAGGSVSNTTLDIVSRVHSEFGLPVGAHLTCVGLTKDDMRAYLADAQERGVDYIIALRGDPPKGQERFEAVAGGFAHANELVALIRNEFPRFGVVVAGYPETHPEAPNRQSDLDYLKQKVDAGADAVITQLFYDNSDFFRFRDRCVAMGIEVPIVPGILPVTSLTQIQRISSNCGANLPPELLSRLEAQADDPQGQFDVGVYHATRQVEELAHGGCAGIHFYVLNKSRAAATILRALTLSTKYAERR
ncbi:MAG: methylenetetrahydrofolate reductase [NAD(P)H] [Candidatus Hydrogenedentes bacterium]|nr:methylenetetrahydrofolate reductase [NAD(P)H] [Candidatus Hydrogenedentota bacterium]